MNSSREYTRVYTGLYTGLSVRTLHICTKPSFLNFYILVIDSTDRWRWYLQALLDVIHISILVPSISSLVEDMALSRGLDFSPSHSSFSHPSSSSKASCFRLGLSNKGNVHEWVSHTARYTTIVCPPIMHYLAMSCCYCNLI